MRQDLHRDGQTRTTAAEREGLAATLDYLRPGDTLVVWKLDRLGRSVKDVLTIVEDLHARGVGDDPHRHAGRQLLPARRGQVLLHHDGRLRRAGAGPHIQERTMAGLTAARETGRNRGRSGSDVHSRG